MLTENHVVRAVCRYLRRHRFRIVSWCSTSKQGEDIVATHNVSGLTVRIEAKGGTSASPQTKRFGKPFDSGQCESHVARALYTAAAMATKHAGTDQRVGIAFPDTVTHRDCLRRIEPALKKLRISVFWVWENGKVMVEGARLDGLTPGDRAFDPIRWMPPEGARLAHRRELRRRRLAEPPIA